MTVGETLESLSTGVITEHENWLASTRPVLIGPRRLPPFASAPHGSRRDQPRLPSAGTDAASSRGAGRLDRTPRPPPSPRGGRNQQPALGGAGNQLQRQVWSGCSCSCTACIRPTAIKRISSSARALPRQTRSPPPKGSSVSLKVPRCRCAERRDRRHPATGPAPPEPRCLLEATAS